MRRFIRAPTDPHRRLYKKIYMCTNWLPQPFRRAFGARVVTNSIVAYSSTDACYTTLVRICNHTHWERRDVLITPYWGVLASRCHYRHYRPYWPIHERMVQQFGCRRSIIRIWSQTLAYEITSLLWKVFWDCWWFTPSDLKQSLCLQNNNWRNSWTHLIEQELKE